MAKHTIEEQDLEQFRKTNIGQPLTEIAKDFQKRALARFADYGHSGLQPAHSAVISHLQLAGTRLTDLARRAAMTKQAMGQLVDEVERLGYVERIPDPTDSRAKIVRFTKTGRALMRAGVEIGEIIQEEYAELIGEKKLAILRDTLDELVHKLK